MAEERPDLRWILVAAEPITDVDTTAADMLDELDALAQRPRRLARLRRAEGPGAGEDRALRARPHHRPGPLLPHHRRGRRRLHARRPARPGRTGPGDAERSSDDAAARGASARPGAAIGGSRSPTRARRWRSSSWSSCSSAGGTCCWSALVIAGGAGRGGLVRACPDAGHRALVALARRGRRALVVLRRRSWWPASSVRVLVVGVLLAAVSAAAAARVRPAAAERRPPRAVAAAPRPGTRC